MWVLLFVKLTAPYSSFVVIASIGTSLASKNIMASDDDDFGKVSFMNSKTGWVGHEAGWVGIKKLGEGGQGCAGLWVKRDPVTQTIIDRVVIKETAMYNWNNWNAWAGKDNKIPSEVYISQLMRKNYNTVQIFAHRVWGTPHFTYRAYMEYCALGDLATIDELYRQKQLRIPEPFLWRLFEDLARAAIAMENPAKAGEKIGPGSFVAHMDIKPGNSKSIFPIDLQASCVD
jgi:hypothetical protein